MNTIVRDHLLYQLYINKLESPSYMSQVWNEAFINVFFVFDEADTHYNVELYTI